MTYTSMQLSQVEEYMRYRKLPQDIRQRVQEFYEHRYRKKFFNEEMIMQELSAGLREVYTCIFTLHTYTHTYIHTYIHNCICAYMHTVEPTPHDHLTGHPNFT